METHVTRIIRKLGIQVAAEDNRRVLAVVGDAQRALSELSMITRELAWQLRTLTRHVLRRWGAAADEALPDELQSWLDMAEKTSSEHLAA